MQNSLFLGSPAHSFPTKQEQSCCSGWRGCRAQVSYTPFPFQRYLSVVLFFMGFTLFMWENCPVCEEPVQTAQRKEQHSSSGFLLCSGASRDFLLRVFLDIERKMSFSTPAILVCTEKPLQPQQSAHEMDQEMQFWISLVWAQGVFAHTHRALFPSALPGTCYPSLFVLVFSRLLFLRGG